MGVAVGACVDAVEMPTQPSDAAELAARDACMAWSACCTHWRSPFCACFSMAVDRDDEPWEPDVEDEDATDWVCDVVVLASAACALAKAALADNKVASAEVGSSAARICPAFTHSPCFT